MLIYLYIGPMANFIHTYNFSHQSLAKQMQYIQDINTLI